VARVEAFDPHPIEDPETLPVLRRDRCCDPHRSAVFEGDQVAIEERVDVGTEQDTVERIEPLAIAGGAPWLNVRRTKQGGVINADNWARAILEDEQRIAEGSLSHPSRLQPLALSQRVVFRRDHAHVTLRRRDHGAAFQ
jgi:hypothetical protein